MNSEICDNSMQATVSDDAMKDDALNDCVAGSIASLDKRKGSVEIGHFERPTLGIGCVLLVYEDDEYDDDDELSVVQRSSCYL